MTLEQTAKHFLLVYDVKGLFSIHIIAAVEVKYKLCKIKKNQWGRGCSHHPTPILSSMPTTPNRLTDTDITFDSVNDHRRQEFVGTCGHRCYPGSFEVVHIKDRPFEKRVLPHLPSQGQRLSISEERHQDRDRDRS
ncbi:GL26779 [Drosophila persimilis]|uniref:GL26779 n=1 Tax=Drosophila persimilis TaxID=7234 RepID=B4H2J3_DROPE|nr:GL26779 [Drosophila persimilis]